MEQTTQPGFGHRLAATGLGIAYQLLPRAVYDRLYFSLFARYKNRLRRRYRRKALRKENADRDKIETVFRCLEFSLVGWQGMEVTYDCTRQVVADGVGGDFVECGVAQGGSALLIGLVNRKFGDGSRKLWLFDSYEGLPDPTAEDFKDGRTGVHVRPLPRGSCLGTIEEVGKLLFQDHGLPAESVELVKGWFQDTLPATRNRMGALALLRLDGDWYESTKVCLEMLFERVSAGGFVIVDDYFSCYGCQRATDEFLAARNLNYTIKPDGRGGAYFRKHG